jgi:hypothetical protein
MEVVMGSEVVMGDDTLPVEVSDEATSKPSKKERVYDNGE